MGQFRFCFSPTQKIRVELGLGTTETRPVDTPSKNTLQLSKLVFEDEPGGFSFIKTQLFPRSSQVLNIKKKKTKKAISHTPRKDEKPLAQEVNL